MTCFDKPWTKFPLFSSVDIVKFKRMKRFKSSGQLFSKSPSTGFKNKKGMLKTKNKNNRKEKRKEARLLKKARNFAYHQRKSLPVSLDNSAEKEEEKLKKKKEKNQKLKDMKRKKKQRKEEKIKKSNFLKPAAHQSNIALVFWTPNSHCTVTWALSPGDSHVQENELKKQHMMEEIEKEEKMIKQLEKQMKLNKRKSKSLPKSFIDDGLDYLMDVIDKEKVKDLYEDTDAESDAESVSDDQEDLDSDNGESNDAIDDEFESESDDSEDSNHSFDSELSEDDSVELGYGSEKKLNIQTEKLKQSELTSASKSILKRGSENIDDQKTVKKKKTDKKVLWKDETLESLEEVQSNSSESFVEMEDDNLSHKKDSDFTEDIYGRLHDKQGNIVTTEQMSSGSYVPPAKRLQLAGHDEKKKLQLERLKKQLKGLINRTSEANMSSISSQVEDMFMANSRAEMSELLTSVLLESIVSTVLAPERLTMELVMLLSILHNNVGPEVGAYFIQNMAKRFFEIVNGKATGDSEHHNYGNGKEMDNLVMIFCHLYNFKVIHSILIQDILKRFVCSFGEKDIELVLAILKNVAGRSLIALGGDFTLEPQAFQVFADENVGFSLRKDDPTALKEIIINIQEKASSVDTTVYNDQSRVKFMLEVLLAIKNNNMRKIPNYDPEHLDHLKKILRSYSKGNSFGSNQLNIGLNDLLDAENKGRWWMVGAAWDGHASHRHNEGKDRSQAVLSGSNNARIMDLAKKQRMNTDIRKNIFCVVMTSEDCVDAFEKLIRLGLKQQQEREIIHVIVECCLQEKKFNMFYGYLLQKFCEYDRRFQMTFQFHLWDKFKEMHNLSEANRENLGKLVTHLIINAAISLSVFKAVEFGALDKPMVRFLKQVLSNLLLNYPEEATKAVFIRIATLTKLKHLHEGLTLFMQHFLGKQKKSSSADNSLLHERINVANKLLSAGQSNILL